MKVKLQLVESPAVPYVRDPYPCCVGCYYYRGEQCRGGETETEQCMRDPERIYIQRKARKARKEKVLAAGWYAQFDSHGLLDTVSRKPVWFNSAEVIAGWCNKRVNIVEAKQ